MHRLIDFRLMEKNRKINILYVSTMCSERVISEMLSRNLGMPNLATQKFHRLFAQGMALNEDLFTIKVLSVPDYRRSISGKKIISRNSEIEKGVFYSYSTIILIPVIKQVFIAFNLIGKIIKWRFVNYNSENFLVFDILNLTTSIITIFSSKILRLKTVAIVTDLPVLMYVLKDRISLMDSFEYRIKNFLLCHADGYVVLTEAINNVINKKAKPFSVIEGFADIQAPSIKNNFEEKITYKIIHYSGGLYEKFGVKALIDAFMRIDGEDIRLHLFGIGDLEKYIDSCIQKDPRIVFFGYKENRVVIEDQLNSILLVNPRFSHEEYTKYSFPSKTIEYMVSGIPLLTTKLPGIPNEYLSFIYLFRNENIEEYKNTIIKLLNKPKNELTHFGEQARNFVLMNKNNKIQAKVFYNKFINAIW